MKWLFLSSSKKIIFLMFLLFPLVSFSSSKSLRRKINSKDYKELKENPPPQRKRKSKFPDLGPRCEAISYKELKKRFPTHLVLRNVSYRSQDGSDEGELDLLVINPRTHKVLLIQEVKCWWNLEWASEKADQQLKRFESVVEKYKESKSQSKKIPKLKLQSENQKNYQLTIECFFSNPIFFL